MLNQDFPKAVFKTADIRGLETIAIQEAGMGEQDLMEAAGASLWEAIQQRWPVVRKMVVVCGKGNNGGDGYVLARLAHEQKCEVTVLQLADIAELTGSASSAAEACKKAGVVMKPWSSGLFVSLKAELVVDALLGIGIKGAPRGVFKEAIIQMNANEAPVLSVDIPSGLEADTGRALGEVIQAVVTVTFLGLKAGLLTGRGLHFSGEILGSTLGLTPDFYASFKPVATTLDEAILKQHLPKRARDAHKGCFGHVLLIGGNAGLMGAIALAAQACLRVGAGLVSVGTRRMHAPFISANHLEIMAHSIEGEAKLEALLDRSTVIAIGPGLGQDDWSANVLKVVLARQAIPKVMDADALNHISNEQFCDVPRDDWILTPHPGEAARLLQGLKGSGKPPSWVVKAMENKEVSDADSVDKPQGIVPPSSQGLESGRLQAATKLQAHYGGVVVLKGAGTVICGPEGAASICPIANPGMATGGMGDVLTGVIAGLLAQGLPPMEAAQVGVYLHAAAGREAAGEAGERGLLASDMLPWLRQCANP